MGVSYRLTGLFEFDKRRSSTADDTRKAVVRRGFVAGTIRSYGLLTHTRSDHANDESTKILAFKAATTP